MRFELNSNRPTQEGYIFGTGGSLAIAQNHSRIAVGTSEGLHILDSKFRVLNVHLIRSQLRQLQFLRSGELLVATDDGVLRLDKACCALPCESLALLVADRCLGM